MPIEDTDTVVYEYLMSSGGINLAKNIVELTPFECLYAQNLVWQNGIVKRGGQNLLTSTQVVTNKKILGLHRFYYGSGNKQLLAASDTTVKYYAGSDVWTNVKTGLTTGNQTHISTWGANQKAYISNGVDGLFSWDGSSVATLSGGGLPAKVIMTLPYQDRLLAIDDTNPGTLTWSASFDDTVANWVTVSSTGIKPDSKLHGMIYHSVTNTESGYEAKVLLAGSNGMYLFSGTDLRTPSTTGNYTIYPLSTNIGCISVRTMCWTPFGTMWLGIDGQVYMLPFKSSTPVPVGDKIRSNQIGIEGIEKISSAQLANACAIYHRGYYILSIAQSGQTTNNVQFWLDVSRMSQDESGHWGPWYGPMFGQNISVFANQNGEGDNGQLMAGEGTAKGYVHEVNQSDIYADINPTDASNKGIQLYWKSFYHPLGNLALAKDVHKIEAELLDVLGTVNVDYHDIGGSLKTGDSFGLSGSAISWNDAYWNEQDWSSSLPTRQVQEVSPAIQSRRLSLLIKHSSSNDTFELYALRVLATEQAAIFA